MIIRTLALGTVVALALGSSASAQVPDHLQCYKIKDSSIVLKGTLDLTDAVTALALSPCKISSAKLYCRGVVKSNPNVNNVTIPINPLPYTGVEVADDQDRLCYKVSCPKLDPPVPDQLVTDQFGQHQLIKLKTGMLCTPASIGTSYCGDGTIDANEDCDTNNLGGATCVTAGYGSGTLACAPGCGFDVSGCVPGAFPASGQTTCYSPTGAGVVACAGTGQDGEKQAGENLAYQPNGDGTITDLNTGLMWEVLTDDGSIHDRDQTFTFANARHAHHGAERGAVRRLQRLALAEHPRAAEPGELRRGQSGDHELRLPHQLLRGLQHLAVQLHRVPAPLEQHCVDEPSRIRVHGELHRWRRRRLHQDGR